MHVVTKFLVVVAGMLAVLLAALTMAFSFNADRITRGYKDESARAAAIERQAATQIAQAATERADLQRQLDAVQEERAALQLTIRDLQGENSQLQAAKELAAADAASALQKIQELAATSQLLAQFVGNYSTEVTTLRESELAFRRREIELNDRVSELSAQREVLEQNVRALREQLAEMRLLIEQGTGGGTADPNAPSVLLGAAVEGRVIDAQVDQATGHTFVTVDLGTNNRMRENLKLFVVRGYDTFVGNLHVTRADLQTSIARFDDIGKGTTVQVGDRVLSRLNP